MGGETAAWTKGLGAGSRKGTGMESGEGGMVATQALSVYLRAPTSLGNLGGALSHGSRGSWDLADCLNMQS